MPEPETTDPMVAALLRERAAYVGRGLDDRVAQVDEQLRLRGHTPDKTEGGDTPDNASPKGRQAPARRTTKG